MASKNSSVDDVRRFQSEVASIREAPEPLALRVVAHALIAMVIVAILILVFAKVDRVVISSAGKVVATKGPSILQALDPSIIKSIDVREGDRVVKGQVIATLDPTFADADVAQLSQQIGSLNAQIERALAERNHVVPTFARDSDPSRQHYIDLQRQLFVERSAQYKAQLNSFDQKISQTDATIEKLVSDESRLRQRSEIAKKIETMRTTLLEKGAGSLLKSINVGRPACRNAAHLGKPAEQLDRSAASAGVPRRGPGSFHPVMVDRSQQGTCDRAECAGYGGRAA